MIDIEKILEEELTRLYSNHDDDYISIVEGILNRIDFDLVNNDNIDECVNQALDDELIYYNDLWVVARDYCLSPADLDFNSAIECLYQYCIDIALTIYDAIKKDDEDFESKMSRVEVNK